MADKIVNGDFENLGGDLFSGWTNALWGGPEYLFNPDTGEPVFQVEAITPITGLRSALILITELDPAAPEHTRALLRQSLGNLKPNTEYLLSFSYLGGSTHVTSGRKQGIRVTVTDDGPLFDETFPPTGYPTLIEGRSFTTPANVVSPVLNMEMSYGTRAGEVIFDDVAIVPAIPPPEYALTIIEEVGGTTDPPPGSYLHEEDTEVTVRAIPDRGFSFDHWNLGETPYPENPIKIQMISNVSLHPFFKESTFKIPTSVKIAVPIAIVSATLLTRKSK